MLILWILTPILALTVATPAFANTAISQAAVELQAQFIPQGSLKPPTSKQLKWIQDSIRQERGNQEYRKYLADNGWNSSGGGGGRACFATRKQAAMALDANG